LKTLKSEQWGISKEEIEEWKNAIEDNDINPPYRQQDIPPVYSLDHYKDNRSRYHFRRKIFCSTFIS